VHILLEATTGPNVTSVAFTDVAMNTSTPQLFVLTAFNAAGETYADTYIYTTARSAPVGGLGAPTPTTTTVSPTSTTINWVDNATGEVGYVIYRVIDNVTTQVGCPVSTPNLTTCTDTAVTPGKYAYYYVYPYNATDITNPKTGIVAHTPKPLPAPIITDAYGSSATAVTLHWQDNATDETGYTVYEYTGGVLVQVATTPANGTTSTLTGLSAGTQHVYLVAVNRGTDVTYAPNAIWANTLP
jgi:hypothetical protein